MRLNLLLSISLLGIIFSVNAQEIKELDDLKLSNTKAVFLGKTKPIKQLLKIPPLSKVEKKRFKKDAIDPNFIGRARHKVLRPSIEHQGADPLRQSSIKKNKVATVPPTVNVDGLINGSPQDPTGAIGTNFYLQAVNATNIGVYNKEGVLLDTFTGNSLWNPLGESSFGDPIILFDSEKNQWIITEFAPRGKNLLLVAISETKDPMGSYFVYSFATPNFPDYPKYAIWKDVITVSTNESGPGQLHQYFIDRQALMSGAEEVNIQRVEILGNNQTEAGFFVSTPVNWLDGPMPSDDKPITLRLNDSSWGEVEEDVLEIFQFDIDFVDPNNTVVTNLSLVTTPYDGFPCSDTSGGEFACVPQRGGGGLDAIPEVIMNVPQYRNFGTHESIVLNFITDVTNGENLSGIRWMELRKTPGNDWSIYQEGTFAPDDGLDRYMGSIAIDGEGNIGLAYNVSGEDEYVGIRYTGRFATDELGEMTVDEFTVVNGTNPINTSRFGDYAHMTVDPVDELTFWYTSEYAGDVVNSNSFTRIVAFRLQRRNNDLALTDISNLNLVGNLGSSESITVEVTNFGLLDADNFSISLFLDGSIVETFENVSPLLSDQVLSHTFMNALDLSEFRTYEVTVEINYDLDEAISNGILSTTVENVPTEDVSVSDLSFAVSLCTPDVTGTFMLTNNGLNRLFSADLVLNVNSKETAILPWVGNLDSGDSEEVSITFTGVSNGINTVGIQAVLPNGVPDQIMGDNEVLSNISVDLTLENVTLVLNTDDFPEETSWQFADSNGDILYSSKGFLDSGDEQVSLIESFCFETDQCYTFTILDTNDDGICCGFGEGSYSLRGPNNEIIIEGGEFNDQESTSFCFGTASIPSIDAAAQLSLLTVDKICTDQVLGNVTLTNIGSEKLTNVGIEIYVREVLQQTINWTGILDHNESTLVPVVFSELNGGMNEVSIILVNPNGEIDEFLENNVATAIVEVDETLEEVSIEITTDRMPQDITWNITLEGQEDILFSGGPFLDSETTITESICLDPMECYTFNMVDLNGICCAFGNGSYALLNAEGMPFFEKSGEFEGVESTVFCLRCDLTTSIETIGVVGSELGSIIISAQGGNDIQYSIDNGISYQTSGVFEGLEPGEYQVLVTSDGGGCIVRETVLVDLIVNVNELPNSLASVYPNPTNDVFKLKLKGHHYINQFLEIKVLNAHGKVIQEKKLNRYDDTFEGVISLHAYPSGVYFIKLTNVRKNRLVKILKR